MFWVRAVRCLYSSYVLLQVKWWRLKLWLRPRQQGALGLTVYEGTFRKRQTWTDTAWTRADTLPTVVLRCVFFYQQPAGAGVLAAAEGHVEALQVVERLHVVVIRHQAGDVNGAEVTSINLRQSTPHLPAPRKEGHAKVTPEHICNGCAWKKKSLTDEDGRWCRASRPLRRPPTPPSRNSWWWTGNHSRSEVWGPRLEKYTRTISIITHTGQMCRCNVRFIGSPVEFTHCECSHIFLLYKAALSR